LYEAGTRDCAQKRGIIMTLTPLETTLINRFRKLSAAQQTQLLTYVESVLPEPVESGAAFIARTHDTTFAPDEIDSIADAIEDQFGRIDPYPEVNLDA
jgi:hypothetical protein